MAAGQKRAKLLAKDSTRRFPFHEKICHLVKQNRSGQTNTVIDDLVWCKWWPNWIGGLKEIQRLLGMKLTVHLMQRLIMYQFWNRQPSQLVMILPNTFIFPWACTELNSMVLQSLQSLLLLLIEGRSPNTQGISQMRWHQGIN